MKFNSDFRYDLSRGNVGEQLVGKIFSSSPDKFEVKSDALAHKTGNLFVEFESRGKPSGIMTSHADYWVFVIEQTNTVVFIGLDYLRKLCDNTAYRIVSGGDSNTSRGILVPVCDICRKV